MKTDTISPTSTQQVITRPQHEFSSLTNTSKQQISSTDEHAPPPSRNIEAMLIKQGKQIRALYELQKTTFEKVSLIQNQIKKQNSDKNTELSPKVFSVSNHNLV